MNFSRLIHFASRLLFLVCKLYVQANSIVGYKILCSLDMGCQISLTFVNGVRKNFAICIKSPSTPVPSIKNDSSLIERNFNKFPKRSCLIKVLCTLPMYTHLSLLILLNSRMDGTKRV